MKKYSLITIQFGEGALSFTNGIMEFSTDDLLEIHVEKTAKNLSSLLEAGVPFDVVENSFRFYTPWGWLLGVNGVEE